jgi:DNA-binding transcriptional LysR family regulator
MNLQDIEAFVAVAETGSVNRAAVRLNLTQPATTRRIQHFEAAIGDAPLFNRALKPAALTALGGHVLEHCRRVLAAVAELETCATKAVDPGGNLKAGIAHGLGEIVLTTPLDVLRRTFPRIKLQVSSNWTTNLIELVRNGALDCAVGLLTEAHTIPQGLACIALGAEQVVVVAPSSWPKKRDGKPWRLRELAGEGWFLNPPGCGCRAALIKEFDRQRLPIRIAAEVFGEDLQLSLLAHSGGLGLVPRRQFENSPHRRKLHILNVADFSLPATVTLIRNAGPGRFDHAMELLAVVAESQACLERFAHNHNSNNAFDSSLI